jgi:hypothetical protein
LLVCFILRTKESKQSHDYLVIFKRTEINAFREIKEEADVLFAQGVTGPDECSSFTKCLSQCNSNKEGCVQFCEDNPENKLCNLAGDLIASGDFNPDDFSDTNSDEDNPNDWANDGIILMQHESDGFYNCFGCSEPREGPALCIDPTLEMKLVSETEDMYCDSEFNVIEK